MNKLISKFSPSIIVLFAVIFSKLSALVKDIVFSSTYGVSKYTDAYFVAVNIPSLVFLAFFATVSSAFLPFYIKKFSGSIERNSNEDISRVIFSYLLLSLTLSAITAVSAPFLVNLVAPGLSAAQMDYSTVIVRILSISFLFSTASSIFSSIQYSSGKVLGPQIMPILNNAIIISAIFFFGTPDNIIIVAIASSLAWVVQAIIQFHSSNKDFKITIPKKAWSPEIKALAISSIPIFISISIDQVNLLIDNRIGSTLAEGSISYLNYSQKLLSLMTSVFIALSTSIYFPKLSNYFVNNNNTKFQLFLQESSRIFLLIALPVTALCITQCHDIVKVLFGRNEFLEADILLTSKVFSIYVISLVFIALRELNNRACYASGNNLVTLYLSALAIAVNFIVSIVASKYYGVLGLALGTTMSYIFYTIAQEVWLRIKLNYNSPVLSIEFIFPLILGTISIIGASHFIFYEGTPFVNIIINTMSSLLLYLSALLLFKNDELVFLVKKLKSLAQ